MRKDSANNKSNYSEKEPPSLDSRSRRFALKEFLERELLIDLMFGLELL